MPSSFYCTVPGTQSFCSCPVWQSWLAARRWISMQYVSRQRTNGSSSHCDSVIVWMELSIEASAQMKIWRQASPAPRVKLYFYLFVRKSEQERIEKRRKREEKKEHANCTAETIFYDCQQYGTLTATHHPHTFPHTVRRKRIKFYIVALKCHCAPSAVCQNWSGSTIQRYGSVGPFWSCMCVCVWVCCSHKNW